jgi:ABC-type glycerol-3-phosphate transport system substrate-binding protein
MQTKSGGALTFFLSVLALLPGCSSAPPSVQADGEPVQLVVASPPGAPADLVRTFCKSWQARADAVVEVKEYGGGDPSSVEADVWVISPAELSRWAAADKLLPVPDDVRKPDSNFSWSGLLPLYREYLLMWDRVPYALPVIGEAPVFLYRSDLLNTNANNPHAAHFNRPPATWKEVDEMAAYFHDNLRPGMKTPSLPPLPTDDNGLEREFYTIAAGYARQSVANLNRDRTVQDWSFHYDMATGLPRIDGPAFVQALQLLQRWQRYRVSGTNPVEAFAGGHGVFLLTDAAQVKHLQDAKTSKVRDRFGVVRIPGGEMYFPHQAKVGDPGVPAGPSGNSIPYLGDGGWIAVVPKTAAHPTEGFGLLAELAGRELSRQIALTPRPDHGRGGGATRNEHFDLTSRWDAFDLDTKRTTALRDTLQNLLEFRDVGNFALRLRIPDEREHRQVLIAALRQALIDNPTNDSAAALAEVRRKWEMIDKSDGDPRKRLATYYISLRVQPIK